MVVVLDIYCDLVLSSSEADSIGFLMAFCVGLGGLGWPGWAQQTPPVLW